jgi:hypothetical protein
MRYVSAMPASSFTENGVRRWALMELAALVVSLTAIAVLLWEFLG